MNGMNATYTSRYHAEFLAGLTAGILPFPPELQLLFFTHLCMPSPTPPPLLIFFISILPPLADILKKILLCTYRVLLGSTKSDHQSLLSELRAASVAKTPLSKVLDARKLTEQYR